MGDGKLLDKINHVIVYVRDVKKAVRFWSDKVGLKVKEGNDDWVELETEGTILALHKSPRRVGKDTGINFWVDDIERVYKELSARGVKFQAPPKKQPWGEKLTKFYDPERNTFTIEGH